MEEKKQVSAESNSVKENKHPGEFSDLGSLDPNIDQTLMRLSGNV